MRSRAQELEGLLFRNARVQLEYKAGVSYRVFHFLTRGKARIPLAFVVQGQALGFILMETEMPNKSERASAASFLKTYGNSKIAYVSTSLKEARVLDTRSLVIPIEWLV